VDRFQRALKFVFAREGKLSNDPDDHGGLTLEGVTQATYERYRDYKGLPRRAVTASTLEERADCYRVFFWLEGRCDKLPQPLDGIHFDACVNHGPNRAAKFLQTALGFDPRDIDGIIGPFTLGQLHAHESVPTAAKYLTERIKFFTYLQAVDPSQKKFYKGWLRRVGYNLTEML
jgi:lysozyme family protein